MKQLQNNFTTPEQSRMLLELGLPADSADCFVQLDGYIGVLRKPFQKMYSEDVDDARLHLIDFPQYIPCWSVGRLIEIFRICGDIRCLVWRNPRINKWDIEDLVHAFELYTQKDDMFPETVLDFSKLEE